jgi:hypothetical protein
MGKDVSLPEFKWHVWGGNTVPDLKICGVIKIRYKLPSADVSLFTCDYYILLKLLHVSVI